MRLVAYPLVVLVLTLPSVALAQDHDEEGPPPPPVVEPTLGPGVAFGYENGLWGSNFTQSLRLRIPFSPRWGLIAKGVLTHPTDHHHNVMAHYGGGRLEIFGVSNPIGGFARVYGGGGLVVTTKVLGTGGTTDVHYGIGGYFGLEVFMTRHTSLTLEVGGSSNADGTVAGATVIAGLQWYFGK
jgi:hypothetical protein